MRVAAWPAGTCWVEGGLQCSSRPQDETRVPWQIKGQSLPAGNEREKRQEINAKL